MESTTTLVGDRIREQRERLGMKPADLARAANCSISAVLQWESNKTKNLKLENLFKIADALDLEPRWLATAEGPKHPQKEAGFRVANDEADAITQLRDSIPEWRGYVLSLAKMERNQQELMLKTMRQAVPDYKVEKAYGLPNRKPERKLS